MPSSDREMTWLEHVDQKPKDVGADRKDLAPLGHTKRPIKEGSAAAEQKMEMEGKKQC